MSQKIFAWPLLLVVGVYLGPPFVSMVRNERADEVSADNAIRITSFTGSISSHDGNPTANESGTVSRQPWQSEEAIQRHLQSRREEREAYPFKSINSALQYELAKHSQPSSLRLAPPDKNARPSQRVDSYLHVDGSFRQAYLKNLHDQEVDEFIARGGFGVLRAPIIQETVELVLPDEPTPTQDASYSRLFKLSGHRGTVDLTERGGIAFPQRIHFASAREFVRPSTFGHVQSRNEVAGFVPHHVTGLPHDAALMGRQSWHLVRLELVSLLRFDQARVYESDDLPRMDILKNVSTRELDEFETHSLAQLYASQEVVIEQSSDRIRMLGALRARENCLQCHSVQEGELLGAFSYVLTRRADEPEVPSTQGVL